MNDNVKSGVFASVVVSDTMAIATIPVSALYKVEWWKVCGVLTNYKPDATGKYYVCQLKRLYESDNSVITKLMVGELRDAGCYMPEGCVPFSKPVNLKVERIVNSYLPTWGTAMVAFAKYYSNQGFDVQWDLRRPNWMLDTDGAIVPNDPIAMWR